MGKPQEDLRDVQTIHAELARFAGMPFDELKRHWESHPEDRGRRLSSSEPGRGWFMSYEAHLRFVSLTDRQKAVDPGGHALDPETLNKAIRRAFVDVFLEERRPLERK